MPSRVLSLIHKCLAHGLLVYRMCFFKFVGKKHLADFWDGNVVMVNDEVSKSPQF